MNSRITSFQTIKACQEDILKKKKIKTIMYCLKTSLKTLRVLYETWKNIITQNLKIQKFNNLKIRKEKKIILEMNTKVERTWE